MVFDDIRNKFYSDAIKALVNENTVVMDLGAGSGLHGLVAAKAGAKKVYLVEPEPIIHVAARVAKENGLSEKTECCQAKVEALELPQLVDVIISVFTGNFLLQEDLLPSLFHARDKHLSKTGRLIPDQAKMFIQPISAPDLFNKTIGRWSELSQGFDFSALRTHAANSIYFDDYREISYTPLAQPAQILHMDFMTASGTDCKTHITIEVEDTGLCHGFLGWFDMRLGRQWLSTSPTAEKTHWRQVFLPLDPPLNVQKGQWLSFSLQRPQYGEWSWTVDLDGIQQKHSTFLSRPFLPSDLANKSDNHKPILNEKGRVVRQVLDQLDGSKTTSKISQEIFTSKKLPFHNESEARHFIANLVDRYT